MIPVAAFVGVQAMAAAELEATWVAQVVVEVVEEAARQASPASAESPARPCTRGSDAQWSRRAPTDR